MWTVSLIRIDLGSRMASSPATVLSTRPMIVLSTCFSLPKFPTVQTPEVLPILIGTLGSAALLYIFGYQSVIDRVLRITSTRCGLGGCWVPIPLVLTVRSRHFCRDDQVLDPVF